MGGELFWALAVTKLHPGAGRSPGIVDLPVLRDGLGYPFVAGSMVKGSLKTLLLKKYNNNDDIKCLLGREPRDTNPELEGMSMLSLSDFYPVFLPAPSADYGITYVSTPYLLARAASISEALGKKDLARLLEALAGQAQSTDEKAVVCSQLSGNSVWIGAEKVEAKPCDSSIQSNIATLDRELRSLGEPYRSVPLAGRIVVVPEKYGTSLIESLLVRVTRVRLDRETKSVAREALWNEEYLPWGTLLLGAVLETGFKPNKCNLDKPVEKLKEMLSLDSNNKCFYLVLGGKEGVGGGLTKLCTA